MPGMHLKQPQFTYSACGPFTKNTEISKSLKKLEIQNVFTKMNSKKLVYRMILLMEILKTLARRTAADKGLRDKAFNNIAKDPKYDGYRRGLASMFYKFFPKKTAGSGIKSMP